MGWQNLVGNKIVWLWNQIARIQFQGLLLNELCGLSHYLTSLCLSFLHYKVYLLPHSVVAEGWMNPYTQNCLEDYHAQL